MFELIGCQAGTLRVVKSVNSAPLGLSAALSPNSEFLGTGILRSPTTVFLTLSAPSSNRQVLNINHYLVPLHAYLVYTVGVACSDVATNTPHLHSKLKDWWLAAAVEDQCLAKGLNP